MRNCLVCLNGADPLYNESHLVIAGSFSNFSSFHIRFFRPCALSDLTPLVEFLEKIAKDYTGKLKFCKLILKTDSSLQSQPNMESKAFRQSYSLRMA